jgi:hypothetical protein
MKLNWRNMNQILLGNVLTLALLGLLGVGFLPVTPALAQGGAPPIIGAPAAPKPTEAQKEEVPTTCGPLATDTCIPIGEHKVSMSLTAAYSFYPGLFTKSWQYTGAGGNFGTFYMPLRINVGVMKNWESYVIVPFIVNNANSVNAVGPNGESSATYTGIGDISWFNKYLLVEESDTHPAVAGVFGIGFPTGHASRLNPKFLGTDAIGTGSFAFTTGFNFFKYVKPVMIYSNLWITNPVNIYPGTPENVRSRSYVTFNIAAELPLNKKFIALFEMYSNWTWTTITTPQGYQTPQTVLGVMPGIEFLATDKLALSAGAAFDLLGRNGVRKFTPMLTVFYSF